MTSEQTLLRDLLSNMKLQYNSIDHSDIIDSVEESLEKLYSLVTYRHIPSDGWIYYVHKDTPFIPGMPSQSDRFFSSSRLDALYEVINREVLYYDMIEEISRVS